MIFNKHPDQHTYLTLSDDDEIAVAKKIVELGRIGRYGDARRPGEILMTSMIDDGHRITNLAMVRMDEMEADAERAAKELKEQSRKGALNES